MYVYMYTCTDKHAWAYVCLYVHKYAYYIHTKLYIEVCIYVTGPHLVGVAQVH